MQAVINASSEGTKLRPLSCTKTPFMLSVADKSLMERLIECLKKHSVEDIVIITGYMADDVKAVLGNGSKYGVKIDYVQSLFADGALKAYSHILEREFLYFSRPVFAEVNYTRLMDYHRRKGGYATCAVAKGICSHIVYDKNGIVTKIGEKQLWSRLGKGQPGLGIYILKRDIARFIPEETNVELGENILPGILRSGKDIFAYPVSDGEAVWDIASYMRANFLYLEKKKAPGGIQIEEGAIVETGALLENPCYIGKGAHVHKGAKIGAYSVVGERSVVLPRADLKRSIVGKGCRVKTGASLRGCVIDSGTAIGENSTVYEQGIVGFNSKLGKNNVVKSFVKIWPEKETEDNITLSENIMWGQKKRTNLFDNGVIKGVVNVDITPRFATLLGECIGYVSSMGEVGISTDGSASAAMLRDAMVSGLMGHGVKVMDFGEQPLPITRRAVMFYMLKGAAVINVFEEEGEEWAEISIVWEHGVDMEQSMKERLEELYEKGDFLYPEAKNICEAEYHFEYKLYYLKSIMNSFSHKGKVMKILLSCPASWGRRLIASAMADFGITVSVYSSCSLNGEKQQFKAAVFEGGFDIGFMLDAKCEKLTLVHSAGVVEEEVYEALCALIIMKKHPGAKIFVPVTASGAIEKMAKKYRAEIIRTKSAPENMMRHLSGREEYLSDQFVLRFDAVGALIKIIEFLAENNIRLCGLLNEIPPISMAQSFVEIPNGEKGTALDKIKEIGTYDKDNPEGVKITFDKGWVVVVPDMYKEAFHVVAEGSKAEIARELCDICVEKLIEE